jgi:hypothetical protein
MNSVLLGVEAEALIDAVEPNTGTVNGYRDGMTVLQVGKSLGLFLSVRA